MPVISRTAGQCGGLVAVGDTKEGTMKLRTLVLTFMVVLLVVYIGVYLSETATNQLRGLGRPPQLVSLMPWQEGGFRVQILGKAWIVDPDAMRSSMQVWLVLVRSSISQRIEAIMAR